VSSTATARCASARKAAFVTWAELGDRLPRLGGKTGLEP
jgi:hypothetical protein